MLPRASSRRRLAAPGAARGIAVLRGGLGRAAVAALLLACRAPRLLDQPIEAREVRERENALEPLPPLPPLALSTGAGAEPEELELRQLLERVSALRGLKPPATLQLRELPPGELASAALAALEQSWPEPARSAQALLLWRLGLLSSASDPLPLLAPALAAQLEAFYARSQGVPTLFVRSTLRGEPRRRALAHELVHALQDHEHALSARLADAAQSSDARSALHALAEADALAVVEQLGLASEDEQHRGVPRGDEPSGSEAQRAIEALPAVLQRSLGAPYSDGRAALAEALRSGGFRAVDQLLREPLTSTHELLQPRASGAVPLPELAAPGEGWSRRHMDVLGEQGLRVVLEARGAVSAAELAAGWRADRLSVFQRGAERALAWQLELATPREATGLGQLLWGRADVGASRETTLARAGWSCEAHSATGVVAMALSGRRVSFASLTPGSQIVTPAAQCATLRAWLERADLALRPGSGGPHRSLATRAEAPPRAPR